MLPDAANKLYAERIIPPEHSRYPTVVQLQPVALVQLHGPKFNYPPANDPMETENCPTNFDDFRNTVPTPVVLEFHVKLQGSKESFFP